MNAKEGILYRNISVPLQESNEQGCSLLFFSVTFQSRTGFYQPMTMLDSITLRERSKSAPVSCI